MLDELSKELYSRQQTLSQKRNKHSFFLKDLDSMTLIQNSFIPIMQSCIEFRGLSSTCIKIGNSAMRLAGLQSNTRRELFCGWFILLSFINLKLVKYQSSRNRNRRNKYYEGYQLKIIDEEKMMEIFQEMHDQPDDEVRILLMAPNAKTETWEDPVSEAGLSIIKNVSKDDFTKNENKIPYRVLNKLNNTGWRVNKRVYEIFDHFLHNDTPLTPFKHKAMETITKKDFQVQQSLAMRNQMIFHMAKMYLSRPFYHLYSLDFRGRIYPNSSYLNEQGNDSARGLLLFNERKPVADGEKDFMLHGCNVWGSKSNNTHDRLEELQKLDKFILGIADDPINNTGWIHAEKPFMFLAWAFEYAEYKKNPKYESSLPIFIDASCNGLQHLAALSLDDKIGHYVNLLPNEKAEDIYTYVADKIWEELEKEYAKLNPEELAQFEDIWIESNDRYRHYHQMMQNDDPDAQDYFQELKEWRKDTARLRKKLYPAFWLRITDPKIRRKTIKRCVMTTPYLSTEFGKGTQIYDDTRGLSEDLDSMDPVWAYKLGQLAHKVCYESLEGPGRLLNMFKFIADAYNMQGSFLNWRLPITKFHVKQNYCKRTKEQAKLRDGRRNIQVTFWENKGALYKRGQRNGTAANVVHSLDACHMALVIDAAPFSVAAIHDSFGCLPADMEELHKIVREQFIRLYETDPLTKVLRTMSMGDIELIPKRGTMDLNEINKAVYAFY